MEKIKLGAIVVPASESDPYTDNVEFDRTKKLEESFKKIKDAGLDTCQINCTAEPIIEDKISLSEIWKKADKLGIEINSFFMNFEGQVWDRHKGSLTMGFVPEKHRVRRLELAKKISDKLKEVGINIVIHHAGFIPDDPDDYVYKSFIPLMREYIIYCKKNKQRVCFETGQEHPSVLYRTIQDLGCDNIGINLDPANLIIYGMANPIDAVHIFGEYVILMHAKDALWPNRDEGLGLETPIGYGDVRFDLIIPALKKKGFKGPINIEREITGEQQKIDVLLAIEILKPFL